MAILSKGGKSDNFESHNSLKLSFTNICGVHLNFVKCESFLESNFPDILARCETNLDDSFHSGNFSVMGYLPLIRKDSISHMHALEGRTSFCMGLISGKLYGFILMLLTGFTSLCVLFLFLFSFSPSSSLSQFLILFHQIWMRFSRSTHLLMCLSLETLMSIIRTG